MKKNNKTKKQKNFFFLIYFFLIILLLIWFNKHPDLRYGGYVLFALAFFIPLGNYLSKECKTNVKKFFVLVSVLSIVIFNIKNILRIKAEIIDERELYSYKNFPFFNIIKPQYKIIILNDNSKAYLISEGKCWATPSPCIDSVLNRKTLNNYKIFYQEITK